MNNTPIGLTPGPLNNNTMLPPPSPMVGATVRQMHLVTGGAGCGYQQSPFWSADATDNYACAQCNFGVDTNKALMYGGNGGCGGQMGPAAMCGQNPCDLSMRNIDDAFESISASSHINSLYQSDILNQMSLSTTKGSYGYSLRAAPVAVKEPGCGQQQLYQGTIGEAALVSQSRFWAGP